MKLSPEQLKTLKGSLKIHQCPNCGLSDHGISDYTADLISVENDSLVGNQKIFKSAMVICKKCGYVRLFMTEGII